MGRASEVSLALKRVAGELKRAATNTEINKFRISALCKRLEAMSRAVAKLENESAVSAAAQLAAEAEEMCSERRESEWYVHAIRFSLDGAALGSMGDRIDEWARALAEAGARQLPPGLLSDPSALLRDEDLDRRTLQRKLAHLRPSDRDRIAGSVDAAEGLRLVERTKGLLLAEGDERTAAALAALERALRSGAGEGPDLDPTQLRLLRLLRRTRSGGVFLGSYRGRQVALKMLDPASRDRMLPHFMEEAALLARLRHPNVVRLVGACGRLDALAAAGLESPLIALEYAPRGDLADFLKQNAGRVPLLYKVEVALDVAEAEVYLLRGGADPPVLHQDLKSLNVLIAADGKAVLADFGLARAAGPVPRGETRQGSRLRLLRADGGEEEGEAEAPGGAGLGIGNVGTQAWMAPEVLAGAAPGEASEAWSFGVLLWELLAERLPWEGCDPADVVRMVVRERRRLPVPEGCPRRLRHLLELCWREDPTERPDFAALRRDLTALRSRLRAQPGAQAERDALFAPPPARDAAAAASATAAGQSRRPFASAPSLHAATAPKTPVMRSSSQRSAPHWSTPSPTPAPGSPLPPVAARSKQPPAQAQAPPSLAPSDAHSPSPSSARHAAPFAGDTAPGTPQAQRRLGSGMAGNSYAAAAALYGNHHRSPAASAGRPQKLTPREPGQGGPTPTPDPPLKLRSLPVAAPIPLRSP